VEFHRPVQADGAAQRGDVKESVVVTAPLRH
jgi:hypothetical protein